MNHSYGTKAEMVPGPEVTAAANFVSRLLRTRGYLSEQQLQVFRDCLQEALSGDFLSLILIPVICAVSTLSFPN